ncbi:hypothetical protein GMRT_14149 [Giardia muris]|uniref:Uncharacterized protein n=1 Tax=Giardia muris TaxID=5742 RepID=A0A4Z1SMW6_GIAMU|nr:hypothetical protein GMRT_14149 [Giardia muris]|eukprot:TNJ27062.1 hypothetical protein GMRT_14149 [Giardia muris]
MHSSRTRQEVTIAIYQQEPIVPGARRNRLVDKRLYAEQKAPGLAAKPALRGTRKRRAGNAKTEAEEPKNEAGASTMPPKDLSPTKPCPRVRPGDEKATISRIWESICLNPAERRYAWTALEGDTQATRAYAMRLRDFFALKTRYLSLLAQRGETIEAFRTHMGRLTRKSSQEMRRGLARYFLEIRNLTAQITDVVENARYRTNVPICLPSFDTAEILERPGCQWYAQLLTENIITEDVAVKVAHALGFFDDPENGQFATYDDVVHAISSLYLRATRGAAWPAISEDADPRPFSIEDVSLYLLLGLQIDSPTAKLDFSDFPVVFHKFLACFAQVDEPVLTGAQIRDLILDEDTRIATFRTLLEAQLEERQTIVVIRTGKSDATPYETCPLLDAEARNGYRGLKPGGFSKYQFPTDGSMMPDTGRKSSWTPGSEVRQTKKALRRPSSQVGLQVASTIVPDATEPISGGLTGDESLILTKSGTGSPTSLPKPLPSLLLDRTLDFAHSYQEEEDDSEDPEPRLQSPWYESDDEMAFQAIVDGVLIGRPQSPKPIKPPLRQTKPAPPLAIIESVSSEAPHPPAVSSISVNTTDITITEVVEITTEAVPTEPLASEPSKSADFDLTRLDTPAARPLTPDPFLELEQPRLMTPATQPEDTLWMIPDRPKFEDVDITRALTPTMSEPSPEPEEPPPIPDEDLNRVESPLEPSSPDSDMIVMETSPEGGQVEELQRIETPLPPEEDTDPIVVVEPAQALDEDNDGSIHRAETPEDSLSGADEIERVSTPFYRIETMEPDSLDGTQYDIPIDL